MELDVDVNARTVFGEISTANQTIVTGWKFVANINTELVKSTVSGGTVTYDAHHAKLSTGAAQSQTAKIETIRPLRYTPGQGGGLFLPPYLHLGLLVANK